MAEYRNYFKEAYDRYINGLDNPIGSVMEFDESAGRGRNKYSSDLLDRHAGQFSSNNPILPQLRVATNKQDIDALYEQAIQWETNNSILQEQREYELPENEIARQRDAGINPDLTGSGSGSGGVGSGSSAEMNPIQGQTKFSNSYDNANIGLGAVNTVVQGITGFASAYGSVVQAYDTLMTQQSRINLNDANAQLHTAQANEIGQLLSGRKEGIRLSNIGQEISNSTNILHNLAGLSRLLSADSDDASILSSIKGLGLTDDESTLGSYKDIVKAFHANPEMQKKYYDDLLGARFSEQREETFDGDVVAELVAFEKRMARAQNRWDINVAELQARVSGMLNNVDYATDLADLEQSIAGNANMAADIEGQMLMADFEGLAMKLDEISGAIDEIGKEIKRLEGSPRALNGGLTDFQKTRIRQLKVNRARLMSSGSEKFEQVFDLFDEINRQTATFDAYGGNTSVPYVPSSAHGGFNEETFVGIYNKRDRAGKVIREGATAAVQAFLLYKGMKTVGGRVVSNTTSSPVLYGINGQAVSTNTYRYDLSNGYR